MNINSAGAQNQVQLYQNNQAGEIRPRQDNPAAAPAGADRTAAQAQSSAKVDISQRGRELQARRDSEANERVADNEQAEKTRQTARRENEDTQSRIQERPASRQPIDIVA